MSRNQRTPRPTRRNRPDPRPQKRRSVILQPISIARRRRIIPRIHIRRIERRAVDNSRSLCVAHTVCPQIIYVPCLTYLYGRLVRAGGARIEEDVVHSRVHH